MTAFTFELAVSEDLTRLGQFTQVRDRSLKPALNKAWAFHGRIPMSDRLGQQIEDAATCVLIKMHDPPNPVQTIWSGPVWSTVKSRPTKMLEFDCVGWLQTNEKKITKPWWVSPAGALSYVNIDAGVIALDLQQRINADTPGTPNFVVPGTVQTTQPRTRTYQPWSNILTEQAALSEIEDGFDLAVDPVTRELNIYSFFGAPRPKLGFELGKNVTSVTTNTDVSKMCNRMIAYSTIGYAVAEDQVSQQRFGVFEEAVSLSDVVDITILQAYANEEVAVRSTPLAMHNFLTRQSTSAGKDPLIFRDFNIGDIGKLRVVDDLDPIAQAVRLFGATVNFNPNGSVTLADIQTTAAA